MMKPINVEMVSLFARIVDRVHALWHESERCAPSLAELLFVKRSDRRAFSIAIAQWNSKLALHQAPYYQPARHWT